MKYFTIDVFQDVFVVYKLHLHKQPLLNSIFPYNNNNNNNNKKKKKKKL